MNESGISRSLYIKQIDVDFYKALILYLGYKGISFNDFVFSSIKQQLLEGEDFHPEFKNFYDKVIKNKLDNTYVKYKGKKIKLSKLLDTIIVSDHVKIKF